MPINTNIILLPKTWTLVTNSNVNSARIQNTSSTEIVYLQGTNGLIAPSTIDGVIVLSPKEIIKNNVLLNVLFPGVSGVNRLYAYSIRQNLISVSHS